MNDSLHRSDASDVSVKNIEGREVPSRRPYEYIVAS
jgi:hypothetical protein